MAALDGARLDNMIMADLRLNKKIWCSDFFPVSQDPNDGPNAGGLVHLLVPEELKEKGSLTCKIAIFSRVIKCLSVLKYFLYLECEDCFIS